MRTAFLLGILMNKINYGNYNNIFDIDISRNFQLQEIEATLM